MSYKNFYAGSYYRATWITDSIKQGKRLAKEDYVMKTNFPSEKDIKKLQVANRSHYTITEALKIWKLYEKARDRNRGQSSSFWQEVEDKGLLMTRSCDSMRNFLKTKLNYGIEPYIKWAIENDMKFSFSQPNFPKKPQGDVLND